MTSSDKMESTTLLNKKNEESTSFKKYLTPKFAIAATATIALGALGVASQSSSFGRSNSGVPITLRTKLLFVNQDWAPVLRKLLVCTPGARR